MKLFLEHSPFEIGAIVTIKKNHQAYMETQMENCSFHVFEVYKEIVPGQLHVRSLKEPSMLLRGYQATRFERYEGPDMDKYKALQEKNKAIKIREFY